MNNNTQITHTQNTANANVALNAKTKALLPIIAAMAIGLGALFLSGHAQSSALHDAAHDVRHVAGFPCH
ncbi:MAG: CbtB domain-containing protein [Alphaproteobacteria bacterium]